MWRNYLTVGFRALAKSRSYAAINIVGLALGMGGPPVWQGAGLRGRPREGKARAFSAAGAAARSARGAGSGP